MLKNLVRGEYKSRTYYELTYFYDDNGGYAFPCDAEGNVFPLKYPEAAENLEWCRQHPEQFSVAGEVVRHVSNWKEPDSGDCACGQHIELVNQYCGACQCPKCGKWYNVFGQELLPPDQWEIDPGEEEYY